MIQDSVGIFPCSFLSLTPSFSSLTILSPPLQSHHLSLYFSIYSTFLLFFSVFLSVSFCIHFFFLFNFHALEFTFFPLPIFYVPKYLSVFPISLFLSLSINSKFLFFVFLFLYNSVSLSLLPLHVLEYTLFPFSAM